MEGVYLLHFTKPYKGCSHYIGWSTDIHQRYIKHISGQGNPLVKAAIDNGSLVLLVRVWEGADRNFERKLKNRKSAGKLCPCCNKNWSNNAKRK